MRKGKRNLCLALAAAAVTVCLAQSVRLGPAYGAPGIETDKECSVTFDLSVNYEKPEGAGGDSGEYAGTAQPFDELRTSVIPVRLYKIADVDISGRYVEPQAGAGAAADTVLYGLLKDRLGGVSSETKAAEWLSMAEDAMAEADRQEEAGTPLSTAAKTRLNDSNLTDGGAKISGLSTGLYLVAVEDVWTSEYIYRFTPYLLSLPGNAYSGAGTSDAWLYDVTVGLKASRENRYGDLEIIKTLDSYNATLGGATFVFQVESEAKDGIRYSDVVSIVFDQAGTKSVKLLEKIPAGARVTVTEVYSGASYEVITEAEQTATITAHDPDNPDNPDNLATVRFENDYDDRLNGGTSVVNHFAYSEPEAGTGGGQGAGASQDAASDGSQPEGVWSFEQLRDSTAEGRTDTDE